MYADPSRNGEHVPRDRLVLNKERRQLEYTFQDINENYHWSLPSDFLGNKLHSYSGNLTVVEGGVSNYLLDSGDDPLVLIKGADGALHSINERIVVESMNEEDTFVRMQT